MADAWDNLTQAEPWEQLAQPSPTIKPNPRRRNLPKPAIDATPIIIGGEAPANTLQYDPNAAMSGVMGGGPLALPKMAPTVQDPLLRHQSTYNPRPAAPVAHTPSKVQALGQKRRADILHAALHTFTEGKPIPKGTPAEQQAAISLTDQEKADKQGYTAAKLGAIESGLSLGVLDKAVNTPDITAQESTPIGILRLLSMTPGMMAGQELLDTGAIALKITPWLESLPAWRALGPVGQAALKSQTANVLLSAAHNQLKPDDTLKQIVQNIPFFALGGMGSKALGQYVPETLNPLLRQGAMGVGNAGVMAGTTAALNGGKVDIPLTAFAGAGGFMESPEKNPLLPDRPSTLKAHLAEHGYADTNLPTSTEQGRLSPSFGAHKIPLAAYIQKRASEGVDEQTSRREHGEEVARADPRQRYAGWSKDYPELSSQSARTTTRAEEDSIRAKVLSTIRTQPQTIAPDTYTPPSVIPESAAGAGVTLIPPDTAPPMRPPTYGYTAPVKGGATEPPRPNVPRTLGNPKIAGTPDPLFTEPVAPPFVDDTAKAPHEMSADEYVANMNARHPDDPFPEDMMRRAHRAFVQSALENNLHDDNYIEMVSGRNADKSRMTPDQARALGHFDVYPDLTEKYGTPTPAPEAKAPETSVHDVLNAISWQDSFHDLYPGYSEPGNTNDFTDEHYFDSKQEAEHYAQGVIDTFEGLPDTVTVYRSVSAPSKEDVRTDDDAGESWTYDKNAALEFGIHAGGTHIIAATIPKADIDIPASIRQHVEFSSDPSSGENENEVVIPYGKSVQNPVVYTNKEAKALPETGHVRTVSTGTPTPDPVTLTPQAVEPPAVAGTPGAGTGTPTPEVAPEGQQKAGAGTETTETAPAGNPKQAAKLRGLADGMQNAIDEKHKPSFEGQTVTNRRAGMADNKAREADRLEGVQLVLRNLADAHEQGTLPEILQNVSSRALVEDLAHAAKYDGKYASPYTTGYNLNHILGELKDARWAGSADLRKAIGRIAQRVRGNSDPTNLSDGEMASIEKAVKELIARKSKNVNKYDLPRYMEERKRLVAAGIDNFEKFEQAKQAMKDYLDKPKAKTAADIIREKERTLIGTKIAGYFPTPPDVVTQMLDEANIQPGMRVLEPSAGKGNIADAIRTEEPAADLQTIEPVSTLRDILEAKGHSIVDRDFLEHEGQYDRIVMNPPFENGQDIDHVRHAFDQLAPGGKIVAIMSEGTFFKNDKKSTAFRDWLDEEGGISEKLPDNSFRSSERPTGVATRLVVIDKAGDTPTPAVKPEAAQQEQAATVGAQPDAKPEDAPPLEKVTPPTAMTGPLTAEIIPGTKASVEHYAEPAVQQLARGVLQTFGHIRNMLAPEFWSGKASSQTARLIRTARGRFDQAQEQARTALMHFSAAIGKLPEERQLRFIDNIETGKADRQETPELNALARKLGDIRDADRAEVTALGPGHLDNWIENYFKHFWKEPMEQGNFWGQVQGRRPLKGPGSFRKERSIPTVKDGMGWRVYEDDGTVSSYSTEEAATFNADGKKVYSPLTPVTTNPIEVALLAHREMQKYIMGVKLINELKEQGLVTYIRDGDPMPMGFTKVIDPFANVMYRNEAKEHVQAGVYVMPDNAAQVLNNYLTPGFRGKWALWDAFRTAGNTMNQFNLGLSAFHGMTSTINSMVSDGALGLQQLLRAGVGRVEPGGRGKLAAEGAMNLGRGLLPGVSGVRHYGIGDKVIHAYLGEIADPVLRAKAESIVRAGGKVKMDEAFATHWMQGVKEAWGKGAYPVALAKAIPAIVEQLGRPLMQNIVPRLKVGAFVEMARDELARLGPKATPDEIDAAWQKSWDSIDNRFGQLVQDNLFMPRIMKELMQGSVRSAGWDIGTVRELGGGVTDVGVDAVRAGAGIARALIPSTATGNMGKIRARAMAAEPGRFLDPRENVISSRTAYLLMLPVIVGTYGAIYQYLQTGKKPKDMRDYFAPMNGGTNPDGTPSRSMFASYMKDWISYTNDPLRTAANKSSPLLNTTLALSHNQDYYGTQIADPDADLATQSMQRLMFIGAQSLPFSIRNAANTTGRGGTVEGELENFFGMTPAPSYMTQSPMQVIVKNYYAGMKPQGGKTMAQAEYSNQRHILLQKLRALPEEKRDEQLQKAYDDGIMTGRQMKDLENDINSDPGVSGFKHLPLPVALKAYDKASEQEKAQKDYKDDNLTDILRTKLENAIEDMSENAPLRQVYQKQLDSLSGDTSTPDTPTPGGKPRAGAPPTGGAKPIAGQKPAAGKPPR